MHTQREHAEWLVTHKHAAWLLVVKANQPALRQQLERLPWRQVPIADTTRDRGHGRVEARQLQVTPSPAWASPTSPRRSASLARAHGDRNIAAALGYYARDATRLLPLLGLTGP